MGSTDKIKVIDANGDGSLSADEHAAGSSAAFSKMDANQDGGVERSPRKRAPLLAWSY